MARMKSAQTVYYGPAYSGYPSVGSVSANESIDFLWTEGAWCYIRYSVSGTANKKCGYVPETAVNHANESPLVLFKRLLNRFVYGNYVLPFTDIFLLDFFCFGLFMRFS